MMDWFKSWDTSMEDRLRLCSYSGLETSNRDSTLTRYGSAVPPHRLAGLRGAVADGMVTGQRGLPVIGEHLAQHKLYKAYKARAVFGVGVAPTSVSSHRLSHSQAGWTDWR